MPKNWKCCQVCGKTNESLQNTEIQTIGKEKEDYTLCDTCYQSAKKAFKEKIKVI